MLPLVAMRASAEVSLTEKQSLRDALGVPAGVSLEHVLRQTGAKSTGFNKLIDASGLQFFINSDITFATTSSGEGAASEASYANAVLADTLNGGVETNKLNDMFDGYNTLAVNITNGNFATHAYGSQTVAGPATRDTNSQTVITGTVSMGNLQVWRKIFVPTNDTFCRWLNFIKNTGTVVQAVTVTINNNLGSDANTIIFADATSGTNVTTVTTNDTWVASFQNWSGTTSPDVRQASILFGLGGRVGLATNHWQNGSDKPFWSYQFTLQPGQQGIIMSFVTGQPTRQAVRTKAASIALLHGHELDFMTGAEKSEVLNFRAAGGAPVNDFEGHGAADIAVYTPASGNWDILANSNQPIPTIQFGNSSAIPVPADYDGDGKEDIADYVPSEGNWYISQSSDGAQKKINWGWSKAIPVPADYDGDGKTDLAVYVPSEGNWYISLSGSNGALMKQNWGWSKAIPVPADYDGDGKTDLAVYVPSEGNWYISQTGSNGALWKQNWGWAKAVPVMPQFQINRHWFLLP